MRILLAICILLSNFTVVCAQSKENYKNKAAISGDDIKYVEDNARHDYTFYSQSDFPVESSNNLAISDNMCVITYDKVKNEYDPSGYWIIKYSKITEKNVIPLNLLQGVSIDIHEPTEYNGNKYTVCITNKRRKIMQSRTHEMGGRVPIETNLMEREVSIEVDDKKISNNIVNILKKQIVNCGGSLKK